ncbi:hypothetical protein J3F84DRAFT_92056 [Trichoderma pleuroticola]
MASTCKQGGGAAAGTSDDKPICHSTACWLSFLCFVMNSLLSRPVEYPFRRHSNATCMGTYARVMGVLFSQPPFFFLVLFELQGSTERDRMVQFFLAFFFFLLCRLHAKMSPTALHAAGGDFDTMR